VRDQRNRKEKERASLSHLVFSFLESDAKEKKREVVSQELSDVTFLAAKRMESLDTYGTERRAESDGKKGIEREGREEKRREEKKREGRKKR
jgi:hypothetical protein